MASTFAPAGVVFIAKGVDSFLRIFSGVNSTLEKFNRKIGNTATKFSQFENQVDRIGTSVLTGLAAGILSVTVALGGMTVAGLDVAASFENAFADVTKTVDAFVDRTATMETGIISLTEEGALFRQELMDLSEEIPVTFEALSEIAGLGGQLGIVEGLAGDEAREALASFTETVAGLAEATNLTQQKAATGLAQISNIFRENIDDIGLNIERLGATLVELGNTSAATESLILNFSQRIAGAGKTVGLTQAEVFGIGTAFASIGITAEAGATAVNRALLIMLEAVSDSSEVFADNTVAIAGTREEISDLNADLVRLEAQIGLGEGFGAELVAQREAFIAAGGAAEDWGRKLGDARYEQLFQTQTAVDDLTEKLQTLIATQGQAINTEVFDELFRVVQNTAKGAELTSKAFQDLFKDDPAEAFSLFVEGLAEEGERAGQTLDAIGLGSVEATRAFLAIAGASGTVRDRIAVSTQAFRENSALVDEVSIRYSTLVSRFKTFINTIRNVAAEIFDGLIPAAIALINEGQEIIKVFGTRLPLIFEALRDKLIPILNRLFGGVDFSAFDVSQSIQERLDKFIGTLNAIDTTKIEEAAVFVRDKVVPIFTGAFEFATEHSEILIGAIKGIGLALAGAALFSAVTRAATVIGFLATPLGQVTAAAIALGIAWQTNFLGIQELTASVVTSVINSIDKLGKKMGGLFKGDTVDLTDISFDEPISLELEPSFDFSRIELAAKGALEQIGKLVAFIIDTPIDQILAFVKIFEGIIKVIDGLRTSSLALAEVGIEDIISGFIDAFTAPVVNLADLLGLELDFSKLKASIFEGIKDFIDGFVKTFTGTQIDLGESFTELFKALTSLGESGTLQVIMAGFRQLGESFVDFLISLGDLASTLKELIGLKPDASLLTFLGSIAGFIAGVAVDQLIAVINGLTGFVTVLTGLLNLDFETAAEGLQMVGTAALNFILSPFQRAADLIGPEFKLQMAMLALDGLAAFQENWEEGLIEKPLDFNLREGLISLETGSAISDWISETNDTMVEGINSIIENVQAAFAYEVDLNALDADITAWIDDIADALFGFFVDLDNAVTATIDDIADKMFGGLWNALEDVDLGLPSFQAILDKALEISNKVKSFFLSLFDGITIDLPEFNLGIIDKLVELGIIDLEVELDVPDATDIGSDLAQGLVDEVEAAEQTWQDAWLDFLMAPIDAGKEALGIKSASTVTKAMAEDVILGYAQGLSDLTPIEKSLMGISDLTLSAFQSLSTELLGVTIPTIQSTDRVFIALYTDTLPRTTSALVDDLIPAKMELTEVNLQDLIPSVDQLMEAERLLKDTFDDVTDSLEKLVVIKRDARDRAKDLVKQVDLLAKAYLTLAEAIGAASKAGDGLNNVSSTPTTTPAPGTPFQQGGSFVVPSNVGSEGMPIRVHANELVQIIPAAFVHRLQTVPTDIVPITVKSPQVSGAPITNIIANNQQANTSSTKEFHLHVSESPTSDVRDSFDLMETLS